MTTYDILVSVRGTSKPLLSEKETKMTTTTRTSENDMTCLHRVEIKANGIIIWEIASESGHTYHVTMVGQHVSSCERTDGEPCKGWKYRHSCHHATLAQARELAY